MSLNRFAGVLVLMLLVCPSVSGWAQQRPLVTEDPEVIGAGRVLIEGGFEQRWDQIFAASGLSGDLLRLPVLGISFGAGSIVEMQIDGGYSRLAITDRAPAPLSGVVEIDGDSTGDFEDLVVATKIRLTGQTPTHPAFGIRFATKLPNASNESGLGLDTTDFLASLLVGKTVASIRVVGNIGLGILGDPVAANEQNDVLTYGLSFARAVTDAAEVVGEVNGHVVTRGGDPPPGTETRALMRVGARYTMGTGRIDGAVLIGLTAKEPQFGVTVGYTFVFDAFRTP